MLYNRKMRRNLEFGAQSRLQHPMKAFKSAGWCIALKAFFDRTCDTGVSDIVLQRVVAHRWFGILYRIYWIGGLGLPVHFELRICLG